MKEAPGSKERKGSKNQKGKRKKGERKIARDTNSK